MTEPVPSKSERGCEAPGCPRVAVALATGHDYDGTPFRDYVCQSCADYLTEASAEFEPVHLVRLDRMEAL